VPALKCTRAVAARARLKRACLAPAASTNAVLGNWYVALLPLGERNAFVYMSERTLLSFIMLEGERINPEKLSTCLVHGIYTVLGLAGFNPSDCERVLADYSAGSFAPADDASLLGSLSNIAQDYAGFIDHDGGLSHCSISDIIFSINSRPSKRLGFNSPFEVTASLVRGVAT
jgi:hypothetical protein